ncbi:MAG: hypothetical protein AB4352_15375 [Hormoscilla sp.]
MSSRQLELFTMHVSQVIPYTQCATQERYVGILSNNLKTCADSIQERNSFLRLQPGLALDDGNLSPFWNELSSRISSGLSLPTENIVDNDENWLNIYAAMQSNSWFSVTGSAVQNKSLFQIRCSASTCSVLGVIGETEKNTSKKYGRNLFKKSKNVPPNSVQKIPLFPEPELHAIWKQWLAAYRWVYNQCIEFYNSGKALPEGRSLDQYIQQLQSEHKNSWTKCLGKTRQEAVCEAQSASRQSRKANGGKVLLRFKSCRSKSQAIQFKNDAYRNGTWFSKKVGELKFAIAKGYELPEKCVYGTELLYQRGQWFACFPSYVPVVSTGSDKVIALDPGNRTFLTGYDGENILEIGKGDIGRLTRLCLHLDKLSAIRLA